MKTVVALLEEIDALVKERDELRKQVELLKARPADNRKKLSESEVQDIRAAYRGGMSQRALAQAYDVNPTTINRTVRGIYH